MVRVRSEIFSKVSSEVFWAQQRPDEIGEHQGRDGAAEDEIEHGSDLSAEGDERDQRGEDRGGVDKRNHVAHGETFVCELVAQGAVCPRKSAIPKQVRGHQSRIKNQVESFCFFLQKEDFSTVIVAARARALGFCPHPRGARHAPAARGAPRRTE
jgi:hypothetical protein